MFCCRHREHCSSIDIDAKGRRFVAVIAMSKTKRGITKSIVSPIGHSEALFQSGFIVRTEKRIVRIFRGSLAKTCRETALFLGLAAMLISIAPAPVWAQVEPAPAGLSPLLECRKIEDRLARVDCYDSVADRMAAAQMAGELVVVERGKVTELKRQLFGFAAPAMGALFGGGGEDDRVDAIESTLSRAVQQADGKWRFHLGDGSEWAQVDFDPVRFQNRPGQPVRIRRAALGSYVLTTGNSRAVRVQRY